jgi:hypothetical protein
MFRIIDSGWGGELEASVRIDPRRLRVISPFIKRGALERLLKHQPKTVEVITRYNLADFANGVSDLAALQCLLEMGAKVRGIKGLHSKVYLCGTRRAFVTSANLTAAALDQNQEFGIVTDDARSVSICDRYFEFLWDAGRNDLLATQLARWQSIVRSHQSDPKPTTRSPDLKDFGATVPGHGMNTGSMPIVIADAPQAFVKFLGNGNDRVPLKSTIEEQLRGSGCHWALGYPKSKRPRSVVDGALMFMGRMTQGPNDIRIFGRGTGLAYVEGRDDATPEDIKKRPWKSKWPRYIRVHDCEFVAGTMANGISLNSLMDALGPDSFEVTRKNAKVGNGNTDPRRAYRQQPAVELSSKSRLWLGRRLGEAFEKHGKVPTAELELLDWPNSG